MQRRAFLASAAGLGAVSLAGCSGVLSANDGCGGDCDVGMSANAYRPAEYEVAVGTTVVWKNTSSRAHSVTAYENAIPEGAAFWSTGDFDTEQAARDAWFGSVENNGVLSPGDTYEHTFETPGTHNYFCIPHENTGMVGKIVVTE